MKCQNTNRPPKGSTASAPKRVKLQNSDKHSYPSLPDTVEDEISYERSVSALKEQLKKQKPHNPTIKDLMKRSFNRRRMAILDNPDQTVRHR